MILKKSADIYSRCLMALLITAGVTSCTPDKSSNQIEENASSPALIEAKRFERDLFGDSLLYGSRQSFLRTKYGSYFDLFVTPLS